LVDAVIIIQFSTRFFLEDAREMSSALRSGYTLVRLAGLDAA